MKGNAPMNRKLFLRLFIRPLAPALALALLTISSCGTGGDRRFSVRGANSSADLVSVSNAFSSSDQYNNGSPSTQEAEVSLSSVLNELASTTAPPDISSETFRELKGALRGRLEARNLDRFVAKVPEGTKNKITDLALVNVEGTPTLTWSYMNVGDYDQNGTVAVADITPLAEHFLEARVDDQWDHPVDKIIDGDGSGVINIADITPIAENFFNQVGGYSIQGANEDTPAAFTEFARISLAPPPSGQLLSFSYTVVGAEFAYLAVRPFDSQGNFGDLSNTVALNQSPLAVLTPDVTSGLAPLTVNFDASESSDPDGTIVLYDWDLNGDGTFERSTTVPTSSYTYNNAGVYEAKLRITDDGGSFAEDSVSITVTTPGQNLPPTAVLQANPRSGDPPLMVQFDASGSDDTDGFIILYEWDMDGDGGFEASSGTPLKSFVYDVGGDYNAGVRVTDNDGAQDESRILITVNVIENQPPTANLSANPINGERPLTVNFNASGSSDPEGRIAKFEWDFEGDGVWDFDSGTVPTVEFAYYNSGTYNPVVRVLDDGGLSDTDTLTITVTDPPPPSYSVSGSVTDGEGGGIQGVTLNLEPGGKTALTDDTGAFVIPGVINGTYTLTPVLAGYTFDPVSREVVVLDADVTGQDFTATPTNFIRTWGGVGDDVAWDIQVDDLENAYFIGNTSSFGESGEIVVLSYDSGANLRWVRTWGGSGLDESFGLTYYGGSLYLAGLSQSFNPTVQTGLLLKYSNAGQLQFARTWYFGFGDSFLGVAADSGTVVTVGSTTFGIANSDSILVSFNTSGSVNWARRWDSTLGVDNLNDVDIGPGGSIYAVGYLVETSGDYSTIVLGYDSDGTLNWSKRWVASAKESAKGVAVDASGDIYITGETSTATVGGTDAFLLKIDSSGALIWAKVWGLPLDDSAEGVYLDGNGTVYLSGFTNSVSSASDALLIASDTDGTLLFAKTWGRTSADGANSTFVDVNGNIYLVGYAANNTGSWNDVSLSESILTDELTDVAGFSEDITGTLETPTGNESVPTGVEDDGGGGDDLLFLKNYP